MEKLNELKDLWFVWGNNGSKHSDRTHKIVQRFVEFYEHPNDYKKPNLEKLRKFYGFRKTHELIKILKNYG